MSAPLDRLKHHVTGAIERGEAVAVTAVDSWPTIEVFLNDQKTTEKPARLATAHRAYRALKTAEQLNDSPVGPWHAGVARHNLRAWVAASCALEACGDTEGAACLAGANPYGYH